MAVATGPIVEHLDVVEDIRFGKIAGFIDPFLNSFLFQAAEEGLGDSVIPAVATPAHAGLEVVAAAKPQPVC